MGFAAFRDEKYLSLETFRKNGAGVKTPVWFAADPAADVTSDGARLFVYTVGVSGKVKRIRNNKRVKIAPCSMRGDIRGEWQEARAEFVTGDEAARGMGLINKKYSPWTYVLGFFASFRREPRIVMVISPSNGN